MKKLNLEEAGLGLTFGISFFPFIGWWSLLTGTLCAVLWALGGAYNKAWRRVGVPMFIQVALILLTHCQWYWMALSSCLVLIINSIGYGLPTIAPGRPDNDEGSTLGKFWWKVTDGNEWWANICTRLTISVLLFLSYLPLAWVSLSDYLMFGTVMVVGQLVTIIFVEGLI